MSIHPFDNHSTDVEQELARELQAIARQIRQALQNHQQQAARTETQESVNADVQIPASPYARLWEERYEQHQAEERAQERETVSDSEHQKALDSDDPAEAQQHEDQSEQAHAQAGHEWDRAEARGERAAYYETHADAETAHAAKLNDQSLGTHPHQAVAAAKSRGPQQQAKPARAVQRQVHQQHELSH